MGVLLMFLMVMVMILKKNMIGFCDEVLFLVLICFVCIKDRLSCMGWMLRILK